MKSWFRALVLLSVLDVGALALAQTIGIQPVENQAAESRAAENSAAEYDEASASERQMVHDVCADLVAERFDQLDGLAREFRQSRARWEGGGWKLRTLYEALDAPHQTDPDMVAHLEHLRHWMTLRPESVSARVALATSLTRWAWIARGNGTADKVTATGWQMFGVRIAEAQTVLDGSLAMPERDPQAMAEEMVVALAQGWNAGQMRRLFERAVQMEPGYQYFYKARANALLPKWYGAPHEATTFARTAADGVGGDAGDYLYFEMATMIVKHGNGDLHAYLPEMDWPRIERGYQVLNSRFGTDRRERNQLAYMAYKFRDQGAAQQQFAAIGDGWSRGVWKDRNGFERARDWASGHQTWP